MSQSTVSTPTTEPVENREYQVDEAGLLFDPFVRQLAQEMNMGHELPAVEALGALRMAAKLMHDQMERVAKRQGLSNSRSWVLMRLWHCPDHAEALGDLAHRLNVVPRTMTEIVDNLERDGLVRRIPDPNDRRSVLAQLTETGLSRFAEVREATLREQVAAVEELTPEQLNQLRDLCLRLVQGLAHQRARRVEEELT